MMTKRAQRKYINRPYNNTITAVEREFFFTNYPFTFFWRCPHIRSFVDGHTNGSKYETKIDKNAIGRPAIIGR